MSWLAPKHLEDAARILRGLALVAGKMASDSKVARRAAASDYQVALQYASDLLQQQADAAAGATAGAGPQASGPATTSSQEAAAPSHGFPAAVISPLPAAESTASPQTTSSAPLASTWGQVPPAPTFAAQGLAGQQLASTTTTITPAAATAAAAAASAPDSLAASGAPSTARVESGMSASGTGLGAAASAATAAVQSSSVQSSSEPIAAITAAPGSTWGRSIGQEPAASDSGTADTAASLKPAGTEATAAAATAVQSLDAPGPGVAAGPATRAAYMEDDVDPNARLQSVHDDVVVAAIASSGELGGCVAENGEVGGAAAGAGTGAFEASTSQLGEPAAQSPSGSRPLQPAKKLRERRVPETPIGRALGFAGLGASLLMGSIADNIGRAMRGPQPAGSGAEGAAQRGGGGANSFLTEANAERLANALCRMRGAALKIGQMLSIQDESVLPPQVQAALERVRAGADVMPRSQLEGVLVSELGPDWQAQLREFEWEPRAAASIGQVHTAVLLDGRRVAMKIQYPGVARSIESDVDNLMRLIAVANVLPRGLYAENAARVAKRELALECDYTYELACQQRYRRLIAADPELAPHFHVPDVVPSLSSARILTTEWVQGVAIDKIRELPQSVRDRVGTRLLQLTLRELFEWRFMQTDPNWGNFLYDPEADKLNLIDFGASKDYPASFVSDYMRMVAACAERDRQGVVDMSVTLGFLTGDESEVMLAAHTEAGFAVGVPFSSPGLYDFGSHGGMTSRVSELGSVMLKHRLTPPPQESYSLHRKLSGAFLACMKLKARVPCRELFFRTYEAQLGPFVPPRLEAEGAARTAAAAAVGTP